MEQCFTLATDYFPEGEVSEKTTYHARSQPSLRRLRSKEAREVTRSKDKFKTLKPMDHH